MTLHPKLFIHHFSIGTNLPSSTLAETYSFPSASPSLVLRAGALLPQLSRHLVSTDTLQDTIIHLQLRIEALAFFSLSYSSRLK